MRVVQAVVSLGLAIAAVAAIGVGSNGVSTIDSAEAERIQAGQAGAFTRDCFQNVSDCIVCTANNTSCTQTGRIDACLLTPPPTLCAVLVNPPKCGKLVHWSMPNCGGLGAISINTDCFQFICA